MCGKIRANFRDEFHEPSGSMTATKYLEYFGRCLWFRKTRELVSLFDRTLWAYSCFDGV